MVKYTRLTPSEILCDLLQESVVLVVYERQSLLLRDWCVLQPDLGLDHGPRLPGKVTPLTSVE